MATEILNKRRKQMRDLTELLLIVTDTSALWVNYITKNT
jgi:hypothetical protein